MFKLTETNSKGWWFYCEVEKMNLSMRAPTRDAAISEAIAHYQKRLSSLKAHIATLEAKQTAILELVIPDGEVLVSQSDRDWLDSYR